jgi:hypothetical protein
MRFIIPALFPADRPGLPRRQLPAERPDPGIFAVLTRPSFPDDRIPAQVSLHAKHTFWDWKAWGVGALFCPEWGGGGPVRKIPDGGMGGIQESGGGEGTPTHPCDHPTPLLLCRWGGSPSPARRTFHTKCRFWNWKQGGVVPCFVWNRGGGGLFVNKENQGEGGY